MISPNALSAYQQFLNFKPQLQSLGIDTEDLNTEICSYINTICKDKTAVTDTDNDYLYTFMFGLGFEFDENNILIGFSTEVSTGTSSNDQNLIVNLIETDKILPPKIDPAHIFPNGTPFNNNDLETANQLLGIENESKRIGKKESGLHYTLMRLNGRNYAVYKGEDAALGSGTYGKVKYLIDLETGKRCALKVLPSLYNLKKHVLKEEAYLKELGRSKGFFIRSEKAQSKANKAIFKTKPSLKYFIAMDLESGMSLEKMDFRKLSFLQLIKLFKSIISAAKEFHDKELLHRDIKLENLVYNPATGNVKLVDLGFVTRSENGFKKSKKLVGTPRYMAPEIHDEGYYSEKTEIYAIGMTFYQILAKIPPKLIPLELSTLIYQMLKIKPLTRPTMDEAFKALTKFENSYLNISEKLKDVGFVCAQEIVDEQGNLKEGLIQSLSSMDHVWLISNTQQTNNTHVLPKPTNELVYKLLEKDIKVAGVLDAKRSDGKFNPLEIVAAAKDILEKNNSANDINIYSYLTLQKTSLNDLNFLNKQNITVSNQTNASIKITPDHFQLVRNKLFFELKETEAKIKNFHLFTLTDKLQHRRNTIEACLLTLEKKKLDLTYPNLKKMLMDTAIQMHHVHRYRYWFKGILSTNQTNTAKKFIKLAEQDLIPDHANAPNKITLTASCA